MSTAVDAAFEEIVSGCAETASYKHALCAACYPNTCTLPAYVLTLCGQRMSGQTWEAQRYGVARCSTCLTVTSAPCGHF